MSRLSDRARALLDVRPGEGAASAWAALAFFAIMTGYFILRPLRDAAGLRDFAFVPWLFTATFIVMTAIAAPWGALVARVPRHRLVPISFRFFTVQLLGFAALIAWNGAPGTVAKVFYVWMSVFNLFVVSVFWSVCADLARPAQGRRLFGPIAAGGSAGTIVGSLIARDYATKVDPWVLVLVACALLEAAVWAMVMVERTGRRLTGAAEDRPVDERAAARAIGGRPLDGLANLVRSPYLAGIAGYALCAATFATFVYLAQGKIVSVALPDDGERASFLATVELWTGLTTIGLQALATSRLLRWVGPGLVLALLPLAQGLGVVGLTLWPTLAMATAVTAGGRAITHAMSRPARELLFTAVPREDRFKTKNVIDTWIYRFGDFGAVWLQRGLVLIAVPVAAIATPVAGVWIALSFALGVGHRRRAAATRPEAA